MRHEWANAKLRPHIRSTRTSGKSRAREKRAATFLERKREKGGRNFGTFNFYYAVLFPSFLASDRILPPFPSTRRSRRNEIYNRGIKTTKCSSFLGARDLCTERSSVLQFSYGTAYFRRRRLAGSLVLRAADEEVCQTRYNVENGI